MSAAIETPAAFVCPFCGAELDIIRETKGISFMHDQPVSFLYLTKASSDHIEACAAAKEDRR